MRSEQRRILTRVLDVALILALLAVLIVGVSAVRRLRGHLASAQEALLQLEARLAGGSTAWIGLVQDPGQLADLQNTLDTLDSELAEVERITSPFLPLSAYLGWLPGIGGDVKAAPHLLDLARQTTDAAQSLADGLFPMAERLGQAEKDVGQLGPIIVEGLEEARPQIKLAQEALTRAAESRNNLDLAKLSSRTQALAQRFDGYQPLLENGLQALLVAPGLLGANEPRTYLLLAQNNHELRATGGFISGVGLVRVQDGQITELHFQDSYAVDDLSQPHPPPPAPLRRHMGAGMLMLRDANWWPDLPTSAQTVANLYLQDQGQQVDGVLAADLATLQLLLQAVGPIQVPGYDQPVDGGNFLNMIMTYWQAPPVTAPGKENTDWWLHRKDFAADLMSALVAHLMEGVPQDALVQIGSTLAQAFRERHLALYVTEEQSQALLRELGWDAALCPSDGDYLMVVDSNIGFNKVNPNIEQTIDYQVAINPNGQATGRLALAYQHNVQRPTPACVHESRYGDSYADLMERCYWDHVRVYLPAGSQLLQIDGADESAEVYEENGKTVVATSFLLETGQARRIEVLYRLNIPPLEDKYVLLIQKQPGTDGIPFRVSITLPDSALPRSASPGGMIWLDDRAVWQGLLNQDHEFELGWK